jgi:hypothetical protein
MHIVFQFKEKKQVIKYYTFDHPFDKKLPHLKGVIIKKKKLFKKNHFPLITINIEYNNMPLCPCTN